MIPKENQGVLREEEKQSNEATRRKCLNEEEVVNNIKCHWDVK